MRPPLSRPPKFIAPQVPILSAQPPEGDGWIHEIKHDGFRTLLRIDRGDLRDNGRQRILCRSHLPGSLDRRCGISISVRSKLL